MVSIPQDKKYLYNDKKKNKQTLIEGHHTHFKSWNSVNSSPHMWLNIFTKLRKLTLSSLGQIKLQQIEEQ